MSVSLQLFERTFAPLLGFRVVAVVVFRGRDNPIFSQKEIDAGLLALFSGASAL